METFAIICAIVVGLIGFWCGYASFASKSTEGAVLMGLLGAVIGAIIGAIAPYIVAAIGLIVIGGYAFLIWSSEQ